MASTFRTSTSRYFNLAWLLAYLAMLGIVTLAVLRGRNVAIQLYGTPEAQTDWNAWREGTKKMAEQPGVVKRREAKSVEPPALVLMRDYFAICLAGALLLSSVLFATFMIFIRGALGDNSRVGPARKASAGPP